MSTRRLGAIGLAMITAILAVVGYLLDAQFRETRDLRSQVDQSYQRRLEIQSLLSLYQDIETGQRGYVVTGDKRFLEPYERARQRSTAEFDRLSASFASDTADGKRELAELRILAEQKLAFAQETVERAQSGHLAEARSAIAEGRGKRVMDAIRTHVSLMDQAEAERLQQATRHADTARIRAKRLTFGLLIFLAALLYGAAWAINRTLHQRQRAMRQLKGVSTRQEAIFDSATDGMLTINRSGTIETLNPAAARMFGYAADQLARRDIGNLFELGPDQGKLETFVRRLYRSGASAGTVQEFWGRRQDGATFPMEVAVNLVRLDDRDIYLAVVRDVTERKQVEQMKTEFVSTVSHELRTPLTSIAGSLGLLAGKAAGDLPDRAMRLIKIAHSNSERLVRLINDILDVEKIESGKMVFDLKRIELGPLLLQAIEANRAYADGFGVQIGFEPPPANAVVVADTDRLMQVLTNLLSNAIKFSPKGETVAVSVTPLDRRWRVTVADRGPGIADSFKDRIFGKFAQADASDTRQEGGTGLGLSIVREIVTRLGGSVSFDSNPGEGSQFHVDLPAGEEFNHGSSNSVGGSTILHVEDDPDVLGVVASAFEGVANVHSASTVAEARQALDHGSFDLIILDVALPDGPGTLLLDTLQGALGDVPVVIFSAQDATFDAPGRVAAVLTKSRASIENLVETARRLLPASAQEK